MLPYKKRILTIFKSWLLCLCVMVMHNIGYAQPANDNCSNATAIIISGTGFGLGIFTSPTSDISKATVQLGETFVSAILGAKLNQKSVWYKFTLPTTRSVTVDVQQPVGGTITDGDVGYTVYKTNSCLPTPDSLSTKLTPHLIFGSTSHICVDPGTYYIQVSSNNNAKGLVYVSLIVEDNTGALYDHPSQPTILEN